MKWIIITLLLTSCVLAINVKVDGADPRIYYTYGPSFSTLVLDSEKPIHNVTLKFDGANLRFNEPRCQIEALKAVCSLGSLKHYEMAFVGVINSVEVTYLDSEGRSRIINK